MVITVTHNDGTSEPAQVKFPAGKFDELAAAADDHRVTLALFCDRTPEWVNSLNQASLQSLLVASVKEHENFYRAFDRYSKSRGKYFAAMKKGK